MNLRKIKVFVCVSIFFCFASSVAKESPEAVSDKKQTSRADEIYYYDGGELPFDEGEEALSAELKKKIKQADKKGMKIHEGIGGELRREVLKALKLREEDSFYLKPFGEQKSQEIKISDVKVVTSIRLDGPYEMIGSIVFRFEGKAGVVSFAAKNPFNDTKSMKLVKGGLKNVYAFNKNLKMTVGSEQHLDWIEGQSERLGGKFYFEIRNGGGAPIWTYDHHINDAQFVFSVDVYGGGIFNDDSYLIYVSEFSYCGFYLLIKKNKVEVKEPACNKYAC